AVHGYGAVGVATAKTYLVRRAVRRRGFRWGPRARVFDEVRTGVAANGPDKLVGLRGLAVFRVRASSLWDAAGWLARRCGSQNVSPAATATRGDVSDRDRLLPANHVNGCV